MSRKQDRLWKKGRVTIDDNGFHVPDDPDGTITKFLDYVLDTELEDKVDEVFALNGEGYGNEVDSFAYRIREMEDLYDFPDWLENNPWDLEQEEIWAINVGDLGVRAIRGEDLRYLVDEARKVWAEREKKIDHRTWWKR